MKDLHTLSILIAFVLLGTLNANAQWGKNKVKGSGNVTTTKITTADYDEVSVVGSLTTELVAGAEGQISITADDNLHELVEIESNNGALVVKIMKGASYTSKNGIIVTVPFTEISTVSLTGSGDLIGRDIIKGTVLTLNITGSGDVKLTTEATGIDAKVTGSGDMKLSGTVENLEVKVSGSGDFDGYSLNAANTQVYVAGSGDAQVTASTSIKARVNGSGDVRYKGNPARRDNKVTGSGSVKAN